MVYEITLQTQTKNVSGCYKEKGYRKNMNACVTAANNRIDQMLKNYKNIYLVTVRIKDMFGKVLNKWEYKPTIR